VTTETGIGTEKETKKGIGTETEIEIEIEIATEITIETGTGIGIETERKTGIKTKTETGIEIETDLETEITEKREAVKKLHHPKRIIPKNQKWTWTSYGKCTVMPLVPLPKLRLNDFLESRTL